MDSERRKKILIVATLACVGLWMADRILISPLLAAYDERAKRIEALERQLADGESLLTRESQLRARWQEMQQEALSATVSDAEQAVLRSVGTWAADSRLSVNSIRPRWVQGDPGSRLLEVQVEGTGDMGALARFIYGIETDPLPLRVEELEIVAEDEAGGRLGLTARISGLVLERPTT